MNTTLATHPTLPAQPIFLRFLWKEYRMLRGFWLAVGVLGVIVQFVLPHLQHDARQVPAQLFAVAWGAAALYAVGAAITLFSAEREERTHDFLRVLPDRWLPMFTGKVLLAMLSAFALAVVLSLTGWLLANGTWPTYTVQRETLAVVGVAIVEATAWGLLFSLWMKQPLLAAIVSMAAASLGAQLAVVVNTPNYPTAYSQAVLARLLVCLGVFMIDIWLASRWLHPTPSPGFSKRRRATTVDATSTLQTRVATADSQTAKHPRHRRMFASLLWQTWRESWKTMLAAVPIALLLMSAISMTSSLSKTEAIRLFLCPLLLPALFGALVFRADQRHGHRQFLVAHAGRPRYVWLARHVVWLMALFGLGVLVQLGGLVLSAIGFEEQIQYALQYQGYGYQYSVWSTVRQFQNAVSTFWSFTTVGWCAMLAAYGIGQLSSMLLKREVLAGFLALLLAAVLTAWAIVVGVWGLNPSWYVLPIGIVAMMATWLRTPDWIVSRNSPRVWLAPALTLVLPLGLIFSMLPQARLDQIALAPSSQLYNYLHEPLEVSLRDLEASQADALATATAYEQLYATLTPMEEASKDVRVEGMDYDELLETIYKESDFEGSRKEFRFTNHGEIPGGSRGIYANTLEGWDEVTPNNQKLFKRFGIAEGLAYTKANKGVIAELETLSHRDCQFSAEVGFAGNRKWSEIFRLKHLLLADAIRLKANDQLQDAFARFLTFARIEGQILSSQPSRMVNAFLNQQIRRRKFDESILAWAQHPDQTSKTLKAAIHDLEEVYSNYPKLREAVLADHLAIRDVLLEKEPARFFHDKHKTWKSYLPYMANKLSWERERARRSLDILTGLRLNYMDGAAYLLEDGGEVWKRSHSARFSLGQLLSYSDWQSDEIVNESIYRNDWDSYFASQKHRDLCRTSYLVDEELSHRADTPRFLIASINAEIARRGLLMQLAMIAYRLDHEEYPDRLEELSPDYFADVPLDPYSQEPFEYRAAGLELPLQLSDHTMIAPNTPLLWTVGSCNFVLKQQFVSLEDHKNVAEKSPPELIYHFRPTGLYWRWSPDMAFPLPVQKESTNSN